jgi:phosphoribosylamine--glycine ligase
MRVLVIGSGGREHALVWKLAQSRRLSKLFCAPGNPGIAEHAECVSLPAGDLRALLTFAQERSIDLTVVGPEQPLAAGIVDLFTSEGLAVFGPSRAAARLEWSKGFAKDFMQRHGIPTAAFRTFSRSMHAQARDHLRTIRGRIVVKADGLAAGKGVVICEDASAAIASLDDMMLGRAFGESGETIVVEEFLEGVEASVFAVCDGHDYVLLAPAQDHKRALDGDRGKNTGGMGAYAPAPVVGAEILAAVERDIIRPTLIGMQEEGSPFRGCLYVGLMLTPSGPMVVEYNCRFGDPETQVVLPLYKGDLLELLHDASTGSVRRMKAGLSASAGAAVCVVLASEGYPDAYPTGRVITGLADAAALPGVLLFHAGTKNVEGRCVTSGGRVLAVTAVATDGDLARAAGTAYTAVGKIAFAGRHFRSDIAGRALHGTRPVPGTGQR